MVLMPKSFQPKTTHSYMPAKIQRDILNVSLTSIIDQSLASFVYYSGANFSRKWNRDFAQLDTSTSKARNRWVAFYAKCPIIWASKLQSQVALSRTEEDYIAISMALCNVIPIMELLDEMKDRHFWVIFTHSIVYCKVIEDNSGASELAQLCKLHQRTEHIN
ncbi:hypothetical protein ACHAW6_014986 [Cyclotella cf. meneghiniana]